jgi:predicted DNA-binding protein
MTQEENKTKRYPIIISDMLMNRIKNRTKNLETNFSNYVRQLILKDLEAFEQSQGKQS